jgi:hypothetical protein
MARRAGFPKKQTPGVMPGIGRRGDGDLKVVVVSSGGDALNAGAVSVERRDETRSGRSREQEGHESRVVSGASVTRRGSRRSRVPGNGQARLWSRAAGATPSLRLTGPGDVRTSCWDPSSGRVGGAATAGCLNPALCRAWTAALRRPRWRRGLLFGLLAPGWQVGTGVGTETARARRSRSPGGEHDLAPGMSSACQLVGLPRLRQRKHPVDTGPHPACLKQAPDLAQLRTARLHSALAVVSLSATLAAPVTTASRPAHSRSAGSFSPPHSGFGRCRTYSGAGHPHGKRIYERPNAPEFLAPNLPFFQHVGLSSVPAIACERGVVASRAASRNNHDPRWVMFRGRAPQRAGW